MDLKTLQNTPPWEWPSDAGKTFQKILADRRAAESDRLIAAELAGDLVVMNNQLADSLMAVIGRTGEPEALRAAAAIALGPVLELADTDGFDESGRRCPSASARFAESRICSGNFISIPAFPSETRRRDLEASVRASEDWHKDAIAAAYSSGDRDWMLTAVFPRYVRGLRRTDIGCLEERRPRDSLRGRPSGRQLGSGRGLAPCPRHRPRPRRRKGIAARRH